MKKSFSIAIALALMVGIGSTALVGDEKSHSIYKGSLKAGDTAPMFELPSISGETVSLKKVLHDGPAVVFFYRGGWCPFCNKEMSKLAKRLPEIEKMGATVIAISPQTIDNSKEAASKADLQCHVLSDMGLKVARQFGLEFKLNDETQKLYKGYGIDLQKANGTPDWELPVPGYYVIGQDGVISWAYANEDYKVRPEPDMIIEALKQLQAKAMD